MFFKIDNARDECSFCKATGKLLKALATGKCICPSCVEYITGEMETVEMPMHQPIDTGNPFL